MGKGYNSHMPEEVIETSAQITGEAKPAKKKTKWWQVLIDVLAISMFVLASCVAANIIYLSAAYSETFFVNGMSMYPTLNANALRKTENGYRNLTWADSSNIEGDIVDYGYCKIGDKDNWKQNLKRNDVVITYYKEDYVDPDALNPVLKKGAAPKVKRLIGLPGETVDFSAVTVNDEYGNVAWGKTLINGEPIKPLYGPSDYPTINGRIYDRVVAPTYGHVVLGENEYYVMGDNRGGRHSDDSRQHGPIKADWIYGQACIVVSMRELVRENDSFDAKFKLGHIKMPWNYLRLG